MAKTKIVPVSVKRYEELDGIVAAGMATFVEVGRALQAMREEQAYLEGGFSTFEEYVQERHQMEKSRAYQLIDSTVIMDELSVHHGGNIPRNERVCRELVPLKDTPKLLKKAWKAVLAEKVAVTAKLVKQIVKSFRTEEVDPGEFPGAGYRVIYADPPWKYNDELIEGYGAVVHHYKPMTIDEICQFQDGSGVSIGDLPRKDAVLFMWVTSPLLQDGFGVIDAWGFNYKTSFVWDKVKHNYGHYNSVRHELLLIATRGKCTPDVKKLHDSVVSIERSGKHSEKPEHFRQIIDEMYPPPKTKKNDRVELFARVKTDNWDVYGNQL